MMIYAYLIQLGAGFRIQRQRLRPRSYAVLGLRNPQFSQGKIITIGQVNTPKFFIFILQDCSFKVISLQK